MNWALHIKGPDDLAEPLTPARLAAFERADAIRPWVELALRVIVAELGEERGEIPFTHCAFGTEFCENLIPARTAVARAIEAAHARGMVFTLLTPYVGNDGIAALRPLFDALSEAGGGEVVFNDWGVLHLLRRDHPTLTPVQGRLLNKSLRDPRVTPMYAAAPSPAATMAALQGSNLDSDSYTGLLARLGVTAVEMDNLPQGNDLAFAARGVRVHAYLPFGFISTSRICMAAGLHYRKSDKFQPGADCRHECQTHLLEYAYTNSPFGNRDQKFYLKGNSYFYAHTEPMLKSLLEQARLGQIARLTLQPRLPMMAG